MTDEVLNKLTTQEQIEMLKEIENNYKELELPVINPIYDNNGQIKNEKEIKSQLKKIIAIVSALWLANKAIIDKYSNKTINYTITYYNALKSSTERAKFKMTIKQIKEASKETITVPKWNKIVDDLIIKRQNKIKIKQVIKGNAEVLNKQLQDKVVTMYRTGKSKPQITKELKRTLGYNESKAKSIALTEVNYYKSEAQLQATEELNIKKTWKHNKGAKEPRDGHIRASGTSVIGRDSYFNINGYKTKAPQHFGIASEDINCRCTMIIEIIE